MPTTTSTYHKVIQKRPVLIIGLIIILGIAITTGFVWMQTDNVIAPPGLRVLHWLWSSNGLIAPVLLTFINAHHPAILISSPFGDFEDYMINVHLRPSMRSG